MKKTKNQIEVEGKAVAAELKIREAKLAAFRKALDAEKDGEMRLEPEHTETLEDDCTEILVRLEALRAEWKAAA